MPLVGGVSGSLALLACPIPGAARWAWVPLVLDPGGALLALLAALAWLIEGVRRSRWAARRHPADEPPLDARVDTMRRK
jgi:hypothetical protein